LQAGTDSTNFSTSNQIALEILSLIPSKRKVISEAETYILELSQKEQSGKLDSAEDKKIADHIAYMRRNLVHSYINLPDYYKIIFDHSELKESLKRAHQVVESFYLIQ
jgi:hypothetical protein